MADIVDLLDSPSPERDIGLAVSAEALRERLLEHLKDCDLTTMSLKQLRCDMEQNMGLPEGGLEGRKSEIKSGATWFAQSAQAAPSAQAPPPVTATDRAGVVPPAAEGESAGDPPAAQKRKSRAATPFALWAADNLARIREELTQDGKKPSLGDWAKAKCRQWNDASEETKQDYARKAAETNAQQPLEESVKKPKRPRAAGAANGVGCDSRPNKSAVATAQVVAPIMTRAEFINGAQTLELCLSPEVAGRIEVAGASPNQDGVSLVDAPVLRSFAAQPRVFSSGAVGYYAAGFVQVCVEGRATQAKMQVTVLLANSKVWEDGEGFSDPRARRATEQAEANTAPAAAEACGGEAGRPEQPAAGEDAPGAVDAAEPTSAMVAPVGGDVAGASDPANLASPAEGIALAVSSDGAEAQTD